jgi:hypothetical protein
MKRIYSNNNHNNHFAFNLMSLTLIVFPIVNRTCVRVLCLCVLFVHCTKDFIVYRYAILLMKVTASA